MEKSVLTVQKPHESEKIIEKSVQEYLPFIATENLMMEAVKKGGDRQKIHEVIRKCSMEAVGKMKNGEPCDLLQRLAKEAAFSMTEEELKNLLEPKRYIGCCSQQVERYLEKIKPLVKEVSTDSVTIDL